MKHMIKKIETNKLNHFELINGIDNLLSYFQASKYLTAKEIRSYKRILLR